MPNHSARGKATRTNRLAAKTSGQRFLLFFMIACVECQAGRIPRARLKRLLKSKRLFRVGYLG
jgi:hypothetical protein